MAQDPATVARADYDAVLAQLAALRADMAKLAQDVQTSAADRGRTLARDMAEGLHEANNFVASKGHEADARVEAAVAANPYIALGLAVGMGVLLGALTRR